MKILDNNVVRDMTPEEIEEVMKFLRENESPNTLKDYAEAGKILMGVSE